MNHAFWRSWILLWALMPVFSALNGMATHRFLNDDVAVQPHHQAGIICVFLLSSALFVLIPLLVLRRFIRGYGVSTHIVILLSMSAGTIFQVGAFPQSLLSSGLGSLAHEFSTAAKNLKLSYEFSLSAFAALPWEKLLIVEIASGLYVFALPVVILCVVSRRVSELPRVLPPVLLAVIAVGFSEAVFDAIRSGMRNPDVLNGRPWPDRLAIIGSWSVASMIGASISAIGVGLLVGDPVERSRIWEFRRRVVSEGARRFLVMAVGLWVISLGILYAFGPNGFRTNFAELRRALNPAPEADVSVGEGILSFSRVLQADTYAFRNPHYVDFQLAPDGRTAVLTEAQDTNGHQLAVFDVLTGARIATLGNPLSQNQRTSLLWTNDGDYLVVRSDGEPIQVGRYIRHETRLTLFTVPAYDEVAMWEPEEFSCQNETSRTDGLAELDNGALAVLCFGADANSDGQPLSVSLTLPSLQLSSVRPAFEAEVSFRPERLIEVGGSVYAALVRRVGEIDVRLADVGEPGRTVPLVDLMAPDRAGGLTFQGFVMDDTAEDTVGARFCGPAEVVSNPPRETTEAPWGPALCRVVRYELDGGTYVDHIDGPETRLSRSRDAPTEYTLSVGSWLISGEIDPASRAGTLEVWDSDSGAILQVIESTAQRPLSVSRTLGLLFTYQVFKNRVAVYMIMQ